MDTKSILDVLKMFLGKNKMPITYDKTFSLNGMDFFKNKKFSNKLREHLKENSLKNIELYTDSLPMDLINEDNKFMSLSDLNSSEFNPNVNNDFLKYDNNGKINYIDYNELNKIRNQKLKDFLSRDDNLMNYYNITDDLTINDLLLDNQKILFESLVDPHDAYCGWFITDNNSNFDRETDEEMYIEEPITQGYVNTYEKGNKGDLESYVMYNNVKIIKKYYSPLIKMIKNAEFDGIKLKLKSSFVSFEEQVKRRQANIKLENYKYLTSYDWLETASSNNFDPPVEKPGWGSEINGNCFYFETNNGLSSIYKWLVKNAVNYGFVRTNKNDTDSWTYKPSKYDPYNMFVYVPEYSSSWMGLEDRVVYTPYDNDLGDSYTQVITTHILEVNSYTEQEKEKIKSITKDKLIKMIKHLPRYKDIILEYKLEQKDFNNKKYLICYYKTKEGI